MLRLLYNSHADRHLFLVCILICTFNSSGPFSHFHLCLLHGPEMSHDSVIWLQNVGRLAYVIVEMSDVPR